LPNLVVAAFAVLSGVHFGLADARALDERGGKTTPRATTLFSATARGSLILALPFFVDPGAAMEVYADILMIVGGTVLLLDLQLVRTVAGAILAIAAVALVVAAIGRYRNGQTSAASTEIIETAVITFAFITLHPLFAIGLYFLAWHSWRHMYPLSQVFGPARARSTAASWLRSVLSLHWHALPLLIPTWVIFVFLAVWRLETWSSAHLAALVIAMFVVVTLPHHLLVERVLARARRAVSNTTPPTKTVPTAASDGTGAKQVVQL
jgi:Brp/Blh family beta-carotene 15,15'-monooxygenase